MERISTTPFGARPVSAGHLTWLTEVDVASKDALPACDKWQVYEDLREARAAFGVTDRDLTVLHALLGFYPERDLTGDGAMVVFPSNRKLSERAHGMAESTLRRHLAALVGAGLVLRHDSPNGKRYAARGRGGEIVRAFGFDLSPLVVRAGEIAEAADAARTEATELHLLRDEVSVRLRDVEKLAVYGGLSNVAERAGDLRRAFRRRCPMAVLQDLLREIAGLRARIDAALSTEPCEIAAQSNKMSGKDRHSEQQYQNSKQTPSPEKMLQKKSGGEAVPFTLVKEACPDIALYGTGEMSTWEDLERRADLVRGMLGISKSAWHDTQTTMGPRQAAIVLACILQRAEEIRSPGGYLRALTKKAEEASFSSVPFLISLTNRQDSGDAKKLTAVNFSGGDGCREKVDSCQLSDPLQDELRYVAERQ